MLPNRRHTRKSGKSRRPLRRLMQTVFRWLLWITGRRSPQAGFVFPTTLLLILMVVLTASALTFRSFTRSTQVISQREQQVIYNAATPAIDRAKAKLEFLFREDDRLIGVPSSDYLANMMLPDTDRILNTAGDDLRLLTGTTDPYTLPDETRIDINGDGRLDNAWSFDADVNANGQIESGETAVYSILVDHQADTPGGTAVDLFAKADDDKADALVTRTGPLATTEAIGACPSAAVVEEGWQAVETSTSSDIQKNFQVTAFVGNNTGGPNQTFESLEFQQSRIASAANKWGAWFRYDLDVFPGAAFKWNGAMHTDGSLIVNDALVSYMLTSHKSCLYNDTSSEITLGEIEYDDDNDGTPDVTFQGQAIKGRMKENDYGGPDVEFHLFNGDRVVPTLGTALTNGNDSVNGGAPGDVAMNPITLYLRDRSEHVDDSTWNRPAAWEASNFVGTGRIVNDPTARPYVDDFYRADNRWGPKPRYDANDDDLSLEQGPGPGDDKSVGDAITTFTDDLIEDENGLDGYWERQAIKGGLRLVVGQRLELGDENGWGYDPSGITTGTSAGEALYPPAAALTGDGDAGKGIHEYRQQTSLRDNLAAVQGMAVYHYEGPGSMASNGEFPAACMALTAHPGTEQTVIDSRTFETYPSGALKLDFLHGKGTNGWESSFPTDMTSGFDDAGKFATAVGSTNTLGKALRNWAYFAGDPEGGAPSFAPVQEIGGTVVHPYPEMNMWGDVSKLRRIFDSGTAYNALSFADQSTLHSAACTMSLLAYNLDNIYDEYVAITAAQWFEDTTTPGTPPVASPDGISDSGLAKLLFDRVGAATNGIAPADADGTSIDQWIEAITAAEPLTEADDDIKRLRIANDYWQIERDRLYGFESVRGLPAAATNSFSTFGTYDPIAGNFTLAASPAPAPSVYAASATYSVKCDPNEFASKSANPEEALTLALALCPSQPNAADTSTIRAVKYPSLYYLFPTVNHDHDGQDEGAPTNYNHTQPATEPYVASTDISNANGGNTNSVAAEVFKAITNLEIDSMKAVLGATNASWIIPAATNASGLTDPDDSAQAFRIQVPAGSGIDVPFLDKGVFNGREQLAVRVLDIDIEAITQTKTSGTGDYWLPSKPDDPAIDTDFATEGILYAAREDAMREDSIVRPQDASSPTTCAGLAASGGTYNIETVAACRMNVEPGTEMQDPPLQTSKVNIKPVDFAPDPDRRPHGFRFRTRTGAPADFSGGNPSSGRQNGMTFVSPDSAYILGNFNLHSSTGDTDGFLEEFTYTLQDKDFTTNDFYDSRTENLLNLDSFSDLQVDHWRPVEILSDALTVLSGEFQDGAIEDAFQAANATDSSFASFNRPLSDGPWVRGNGDVADYSNSTSPIWVDRNGTFYMDDGTGTINEYFDVLTDAADYLAMGERDPRRANMPAPSTNYYVNATFVSGIVPERPNESYGGLHNYPRFLENWGGQNGQALYISGSFIQLNFSTTATGPYDQEAWEPGTTPAAAEWLYHYRPPNRRWGFDVGLLYNPPAPAARRFTEVGRDRSEYYREVAADDPYVENLKCATTKAGAKIFPNYCP